MNGGDCLQEDVRVFSEQRFTAYPEAHPGRFEALLEFFNFVLNGCSVL
jgi:hypothetical protein